MKHAKRNILIALLAFAMLFTMLPLRGGHAYADEEKNVGAITLNISNGQATLSGYELEAFDNVMTELANAGRIKYLDFFSKPQYGLDENNQYEFEKGVEDGKAVFSLLSSCTVKGIWTTDDIDINVWNNIKESLKKDNKAYCDKIEIIFPELYDVWIEGTQLNKNNAADFKGDGTVKYDAANKTLMLNGASLSISGNDGINTTAVKSREDLNIVLMGDNRIELDTQDITKYLYGILCYKTINISGTGSLDIVIESDKRCYGIDGDGISINGARTSISMTAKDTEYSAESGNDSQVVGINSHNGFATAALRLTNGATLDITATGSKASNNTALLTNRLSVDNYSKLEAFSKGEKGVLINAAEIDSDTLARGALVNEVAIADGAHEWNKTDDLKSFKYIRMPGKHEHLWDAGVVTRKPTATSQGVRTYTCRTCGETKTEAISNAAEKEAAKKAASNINKSTVTAADIKKASNLGATTVTLGAKVKKISKNAFKGTKINTVIVKTKKLKKASVKKALTGSKVTKIKVNIGKKKVNKTYVKKYKKIFTKKNAGKKVKVSL